MRYSIWKQGKIWSFKNRGSFMFLPRDWRLFCTIWPEVLFTQVGPFRLTWPRTDRMGI